MLATALIMTALPTLALYAAVCAYAAWDQREAGFPDWWSMAIHSSVFSATILALAAYAWSLL